MKKLSDFLKQAKRSGAAQEFSGGDNTQFTATYATRGGFAASQMGQHLVAITVWFQVHGQPLLRKLNWSVIRTSSYILAATFVLANVVSTSAAQASFKLFHGAKRAGANHEMNNAIFVPSASVGGQRTSTSAVKDVILKRNLFNSEGTLAPEADKTQGQKSDSLDFGKVECSTEKLPVEVLGTIYTGNPFDSVVIIKDPKIADADIYQAGKAIIDNEDYEIFKVGQGTVEFRKGDNKICVDLTGREPQKAAAATVSLPKAEVVETIDLSDEEMKNLLGPELARAMNEAKLIPDPAPGGMGIQGFRLLAIVPGSIFDRVKLQNEDLLLEVNGQSLKDPGQGYRLLEALQQQREITINFTRKGEPMVRKVRVK